MNWFRDRVLIYNCENFWEVLECNADISTKAALKNKDCSRILVAFDKYCLSDSHTKDLENYSKTNQAEWNKA